RACALDLVVVRSCRVSPSDYDWLVFFMLPPPPGPTLFPYTTLFRSVIDLDGMGRIQGPCLQHHVPALEPIGVRERHRFVSRPSRSEEHTSELQSRENLVCRLLLEKKNRPRLARAPPTDLRNGPRRAQ